MMSLAEVQEQFALFLDGEKSPAAVCSSEWRGDGPDFECLWVLGDRRFGIYLNFDTEPDEQWSWVWTGPRGFIRGASFDGAAALTALLENGIAGIFQHKQLQQVSLLTHEVEEATDRVAQAVSLAERYGSIDGEHHKTWVIDQILRALLDDGYAVWKAKRNGQTDYEPWDEGIAP